MFVTLLLSYKGLSSVIYENREICDYFLTAGRAERVTAPSGDRYEKTVF